jgi:Protein of unknown function (DUF3500)
MQLFRTPRVLLALACLSAALAGGLIAAERSSSTMASAATSFLGSLSPEQRQKATFVFESDERTHWHFIPTDAFPRKGLTLKEMSVAQRENVRGLLKAGLSQRGYLTATQIMDLEALLGQIEQSARASGRGAESMVRDPERYFVSIFGTPSTSATWGWRVEGHHVSLQFTIVNGSLVANSPFFFGSNPAEVREGPQKGLRILAQREDTARALVTALDPSQLAKAVIQNVALNDIVTENKVSVDPLSPVGIAAGALTPAQRDLLMKVVEAYTSAMADDIAAERMAQLRKAGLEKITFAWAGELERGKKHYYRVQGPTFLVEFDNTQNNGNHIHSVWRDFQGDFGRDLLREHLRSVAH